MKYSIACLWLVLLSATFGGSSQDTYSNPYLGISITKPASWQFLTPHVAAERAKDVKLEDEKLRELFQRYMPEPIVTMIKHPEPFEDINPSLKINIRPLGNFNPEQPKEILAKVLPIMERMFANLKVVIAPTNTELVGRKAGYMKFNSTQESFAGERFPVSTEMWVVPRGKDFFMIAAGTRQDEKTGSAEEIRSILSSLKLE